MNMTVSKKKRVDLSIAIAVGGIILYMAISWFWPASRFIAMTGFVFLWAFLMWYMSDRNRVDLTVQEIYAQAKQGRIKTTAIEKGFSIAGILFIIFFVYQTVIR